MKYQLWQNKEPTFMSPFAQFNNENFEHVATVECENIEDIFAMTNHGEHIRGRINGDWTHTTGVTPVNDRTGRNTRSTSVGDLVVDDKNQIWYCAVGWKKAEDVTII